MGNWQSRSASAKLPSLATLADGDLNPTISTPGFAVLEAQTMGTLGTPSDGFHLDYDPMLSAQIDDPKLISGFDTDIAAASFKPGRVQVEYFNPIGNSIPRVSGLGVVTMQNVDNALNGKVKASPGGGGGTVGGGPPGDCAPGGPPLAQSPKAGDFGSYSVPSSNVRVFNPRKLRDPNPQPWYISSLSTPTTAQLLYGDRAVWGLQVLLQKPENTPPPLYYVILTANTGKQGHFGAVVQVTVQGQKPTLWGGVVDVGGCEDSSKSGAASPPVASPQLVMLQTGIKRPR